MCAKWLLKSAKFREIEVSGVDLCLISKRSTDAFPLTVDTTDPGATTRRKKRKLAARSSQLKRFREKHSEDAKKQSAAWLSELEGDGDVFEAPVREEEIAQEVLLSGETCTKLMRLSFKKVNWLKASCCLLRLRV